MWLPMGRGVGGGSGWDSWIISSNDIHLIKFFKSQKKIPLGILKKIKLNKWLTEWIMNCLLVGYRGVKRACVLYSADIWIGIYEDSDIQIGMVSVPLMLYMFL